MDAPKQAIVFSGGGAYGAYEIGVLKALAEGGLAAPDIVGGASAGAINAALLAASREPDLRTVVQRMENVWANRIPGHVFEVRADPRSLLGFGSGSYLSAAARWIGDIETLSLNFGKRLFNLGAGGLFDERLLQLVDLASFVSVAPLEELLREVIEPKKLRESSMKLSVTTTNWTTGQAEVFTNEKMTDSDAVALLLASAAIPGFFPPRQLRGSVYVDGGLIMSTPLQPVIADGADEIRIIYLDPDIGKIPVHRLQNTFDTLDRVLAINQAFHINADIENARQINRAIELFDPTVVSIAGPRKSEMGGIARHWEKLRSERPPRTLTIHRYHPRHDLGGLLGLLRFERQPIEDLIRHGYDDTKHHDCRANGCEVRAKAAPAPNEQPTP